MFRNWRVDIFHPIDYPFPVYPVLLVCGRSKIKCYSWILFKCTAVDFVLMEFFSSFFLTANLLRFVRSRCGNKGRMQKRTNYRLFSMFKIFFVVHSSPYIKTRSKTVFNPPKIDVAEILSQLLVICSLNTPS